MPAITESLLSVENVLSVLDGVTRTDTGYKARCPHPSHPDRKPSFDVTRGNNGEAIFHCHSRHCEVSGILADLIRQRDPNTPPLIVPPLPAPPPKLDKPSISDSQILTWCERLQDELNDPFSDPSESVEYFQRRGISSTTLKLMKVGSAKYKVWHNGSREECASCDDCQTLREVVTIPRYRNGQLRGVKYRAVTPTDNHKWSQAKGSANCQFLYGLANRADSNSSSVVIAEGEHEFLLLHTLGINAVGILGSAGVPKTLSGDFAEDVQTLKATYSHAILIADNDTGAGVQTMDRFAAHLGDFPSSIVTVPQGKDFGEFYSFDNGIATNWINDLSRTALDAPDWLSELGSGVSVPVAETEYDESRYPIEVWDGTAYGDFAKLCGRSNKVSPELFVESLKTVTGAVMGSQLRIANMSQDPRFYTAFIAGGGTGKSTAIKWAMRVFGEGLLYSHGTSPYSNIGAFCGAFGSGTGLVQTIADHPRILIHNDEIENLIEKFAITGSGGSLLATVNTLYDDTRAPMNITKDTKKGLAESSEAHLSIIGCATPDKWQSMFAKTGAVGSGFFQRLNIIRTENEQTVAVMNDPVLTDFQSSFRRRILELETLPVDCIFAAEAGKVFEQEWQHWIKAQDQPSEITGRLNVQIQRNAMHLAWLLDRRENGQCTIDVDIIRRAIKLAKYELHVRRESRPIEGENPFARLENLVIQTLQKSKSLNRTELRRKTNAHRYGTTMMDKVLSALEAEGMIEKEPLPTKGRKLQVVKWIG